MLGMQYAYPKLELHLMLNAHHTRFQDIFFTYYSLLAEGPLYVLALLPIFWKQLRLTLFFALSELTAGAILQMLKHLISMPRPSSAFEEYPDMVLPVVEGINLHCSNSFPSGHASTFFVFSTCLAFFLAYHYQQRGNKTSPWAFIRLSIWLMLLLIFAALGAYSRVYLSQHFLSDICMGSLIGFLTPCLILYLGKKKILKLDPVDSPAE